MDGSVSLFQLRFLAWHPREETIFPLTEKIVGI